MGVFVIQVLSYIQEAFAMWQKIDKLSFEEMQCCSSPFQSVPLNISKSLASAYANHKSFRSIDNRDIDINIFFVK